MRDEPPVLGEKGERDVYMIWYFHPYRCVIFAIFHICSFKPLYSNSSCYYKQNEPKLVIPLCCRGLRGLTMKGNIIYKILRSPLIFDVSDGGAGDLAGSNPARGVPYLPFLSNSVTCIKCLLISIIFKFTWKKRINDFYYISHQCFLFLGFWSYVFIIFFSDLES